jgi:hypothetical protein
MQIPCVYLPGPAPAVSVANNSIFDDIFWMCYAAFCALAFTFKIYGERVGAISVNFFSRKMS